MPNKHGNKQATGLTAVSLKDYPPHDHARSRACRWGEDGLFGFTDRERSLCFALTLWNSRLSLMAHYE